MEKIKITRVWVDISFKRALKRMAAEQDKTILSLSKELAEKDDFILDFETPKEKRKNQRWF